MWSKNVKVVPLLFSQHTSLLNSLDQSEQMLLHFSNHTKYNLWGQNCGYVVFQTSAIKVSVVCVSWHKDKMVTQRYAGL